MSLAAAAAFIQSHQRFYLAAHQSPDGDTLGSCLALQAALRALGKEATVVCQDAMPENLSFLDGIDAVRGADGLTPPEEAVLYIDCADHARTGSLQPILEQAPYAFCIDHHGTNPRTTKDGDWVEEVGATGELILKLIETLHAPITKAIAVALYTAITTDTGNFAYSNTTPDTFLAGAKLLAYGIDLPELNRTLFRTMKLSKARLVAYVLGSMQLWHDGALAIAAIPHAVMQRLGAGKEDCEGLIDYLRDIDVVEVACVLREEADGTVRVSMRSKRFCDVATVGKAYGGGGHVRAAGCTLYQPLETATETMRDALLGALA